MNIDLQAREITPLRQTYAHVAAYIGGDKAASRYQEATLGAQPSASLRPSTCRRVASRPEMRATSGTPPSEVTSSASARCCAYPARSHCMRFAPAYPPE